MLAESAATALMWLCVAAGVCVVEHVRETKHFSDDEVAELVYRRLAIRDGSVTVLTAGRLWYCSRFADTVYHAVAELV